MKMLSCIYKKLLPLTLSATLIINVQMPLFAQQANVLKKYTTYTAVKDNTTVANKNLDIAIERARISSVPSAAPFTLTYEQVAKAATAEAKNTRLSKQDIDAIYTDYIKEMNTRDAQVSAVFNMLKKEYNPKSLINYFDGKADKKTGIVCEEKKCYPLEIYLQGVLRVILYQIDKKNREDILLSVPAIYTIVTGAGINRNDAAPLEKTLRYLLEKSDKYCDNDTYKADIAPGLAGPSGAADARQGKERRQNECQSIGKAMVVLGLIGPWYKDKYQNASIIYKAVKDTYGDDYGAITLSMGINALMAIDTPSAYGFIDALLTKDTLPASTAIKAVKDFGGQILDLLSVSSWADKGISAVNFSRGGGGRYLNNYNQTLQYIDEDYARICGVSDFSLSVAKTNPSIAYNIPYRNVLEDIGIMLGETKNPAGKKLIQKILALYNEQEAARPACIANGKASILSFEMCSPGKRVHLPLVSGILQSAPQTSSAASSAKLMNTLDWWDLNEATQRRINNSVTKFAGTVKRDKNQAKIKRNDANKKIATAAFWTDILVTAIFITTFIRSIPSLLKSASNAARTLRITMSGKGSLLKITRARIAASGVNAAEVRASLSAKYKASKVNVKPIKSPSPRMVEKPTKVNNKLDFKLTGPNGKTVTATYSTSKSGVTSIKIKPSPSNARSISGTLQETNINTSNKAFFNNLTAQVGEGSGGAGVTSSYVTSSSAAVSASAVKPVPFTLSEQVANTVKTNPVFIAAENKIIPAQRLNSAIFKGSLSYYKNIANQFARTLRTRTGALGMFINVSLVNPAFLNAASSGKIMPIVETLSSAELSAGKVGSIARAGKSIKLAQSLPKEINLVTRTEQVIKFEEANPVKTILQTKPNKPLTEMHFKYTGTPHMASNPMFSKYALASYFWATSLTFSPFSSKANNTQQKATEKEKQQNELFLLGEPTVRQQLQYSSLVKSARENIDEALENGAVISQHTIDLAVKAFPSQYTKEQLKFLTDKTYSEKLMFVSGLISKSMFDKLLAMALPEGSEETMLSAIQTGDKKVIDKLVKSRQKNIKFFNNYFDAIQITTANGKAAFLTLNSEKGMPNTVDDALDAVIVQDDIVETMERNFFRTKSIKDIVANKLAFMTAEEKDAIIGRIISLNKAISSLEQKGYKKNTIKPVLMGKAQGWEEIETLKPRNIIISVEEEKGNLGLAISKWIETQGVPSADKADYKKYAPAWIAAQLGLSAQNPGKMIHDSNTGNYLIYNQSGTARVRFGPHEMNPSNTHIHIEKINTNGLWDGIENASYTVGIPANIKSAAERARSTFESSETRTPAQLNEQAEEISKAFAPLALFFGSQDVYNKALALPRAENKEQAARNLFTDMETIALQTTFLTYLETLQRQGLVK